MQEQYTQPILWCSTGHQSLRRVLHLYAFVTDHFVLLLWFVHMKLWHVDRTWSAVNFEKHVTLISSKLEPPVWLRDTGQWIPCIDRCQLTRKWMSKVKEVRYKPRVHRHGVHVSLNLEYGRHLARLRCRRAYTPTSNAASHENHEKINPWVSLLP